MRSDDELEFADLDRDLVVDALEDDGDDLAPEHALLGRAHFDVFGADDDVHLFVDFEIVDAGKVLAAEAHLAGGDHRADDDVALADLLHHAVRHDDDGIRHRERLLLVVRDIDEGDAEALVHLFELDLHLLPHLEVEGAEGLVEEQDLGLVDEGAGDGDALLLPAREGGDGALFKPFEVDERERLFHLLRDLLFGELFLLRIPIALVVFVSVHDLLAAKPEGDVFEHVEVGEEGIALEHRIDGAHPCR